MTNNKEDDGDRNKTIDGSNWDVNELGMNLEEEEF